MARKTPADFNYDYDKFVKYLNSAECSNDDGIDIYVDEKGNIYTRTNGDWTVGHGHDKGKYHRDANDPDSFGRSWKNPW